MFWRMLCDMHLPLRICSSGREIIHADKAGCQRLLQIQTRCMCCFCRAAFRAEYYNLAFPPQS